MQKVLFYYPDGTNSVHEVIDKLELFQLIYELDYFEDMYVWKNENWKKVKR